MKNVVLLGASGSIGTSTAKVAEDLPGTSPSSASPQAATTHYSRNGPISFNPNWSPSVLLRKQKG